MSVLILLLAISLVISGGFLAAFLWSARDGQFEDEYSPANRILFEEKNEQTNITNSKTKETNGATEV